LPPARTGIANYSSELLEHLAGTAKLTLFTGTPSETESTFAENYDIQPISDYAKCRWDYDCAIYQVGNSLHHREIYQVAIRYPGIVVLHDLGLHHFIAEITAGSGNFSDYVRDMAYAGGVGGAEFAWQVRFEQKSPPIYEMPLNDRLLERSQVIVTHSIYIAEAVRSRFPDRTVQVIPHLIKIRPGHSQREALNVSEDVLIFAAVGLLTGDKHIDLTLRAISEMRQEGRDVFFLLVGQAMPEVDIDGLINEYNLGESLKYTGFAEGMNSFFDWIATADVIVNLRHPTVGETSGSVLRALSLGRPVIVFDEGWYSELPESVCWKVSPMDYEHLLHVMQEASRNANQVNQKGKNALKYIKETCDPVKISNLYLQTIDNYLARINAKFVGTPSSG
jgi:glycosyltransferase involved in cell wall biosynthesis